MTRGRNGQTQVLKVMNLRDESNRSIQSAITKGDLLEAVNDHSVDDYTIDQVYLYTCIYIDVFDYLYTYIYTYIFFYYMYIYIYIFIDIQIY